MRAHFVRRLVACLSKSESVEEKNQDLKSVVCGVTSDNPRVQQRPTKKQSYDAPTPKSVPYKG